MDERKTIFALSTPRGRGAIAVIRISGPAAGGAVESLAGRLPAPRQAKLVQLRDPAGGDLLDRALCLWFPGPESYTGEDLAELQIHGGRAVIEGMLRALAALPGLAPAEPGAFTRRAFLNGRMDLTAAEGIADLIEAETAAQRRLALRAMDGELARLIEPWRAALLRGMALLEADIDFPEEELGSSILGQARTALEALQQDILHHLAESQKGARLRDGFRIALLGEPNVGKSSLLNALARRDVAIVTDRPGTTRDILEVHLELGGYPVIVADMAGLRQTDDPIETIGIGRAELRAENSDLRLLLMEAARTPSPIPEALARLRQAGDILVFTKADLVQSQERHSDGLRVSALTGEGLPDLLKELEVRAGGALSAGETPLFTRLRHQQALRDCQAALAQALGQWGEAPAELLAEDLRVAARALGRLTGLIDVEELLDMIFGEFCIGK